LLGLLGPLVVMAPIARQFPQIGAPPTTSTSWAFGALLATVAALATTAMATSGAYAPNPATTPAAAVAAMKAANADVPVFNDYDFGGYLIFSGVPTFIDGRTELFGGGFTADYYRAVTLADMDGFVSLLDTYRISATLLTANTPANALLDRLPGWHRLYADDVAVVHIRTPIRATLP
jgi:hypothetical protein